MVPRAERFVVPKMSPERFPEADGGEESDGRASSWHIKALAIAAREWRGVKRRGSRKLRSVATAERR